MLSTVTVDVFDRTESAALALAIDDLCSPSGGSEFGAAGLYAYWDPLTKELLYVGLASDLGIRFRQHNALTRSRPAGSKVGQIEEFFAREEQLGLSLMPQSPIDFSNSSRSRSMFGDDVEARAVLADRSEPGHGEIVDAEGQILAAHVRRYGKLPPWNRIGGSAYGASQATADTEPYLDLLRLRYRSALTAGPSVRALATDPEAAHFEALLHVVRWECILLRGGISQQLLRRAVAQRAAASDDLSSSEFRRLEESGYMELWYRDR